MTTKRGEGVAKRRELLQRLRRIATGLRIEGAINMAGTLVQAAEVIEASSPSALIDTRGMDGLTKAGLLRMHSAVVDEPTDRTGEG